MNEKQRDGMERAGETGEIIDRRAGERRAAAPVVAVVAAKLPDVNNVCAVERPSDMGITIKFMSTRAASQFEREFSQMWVASLGLASQAQAAVRAPALVNIEHLSRYDLVFNDGEACIEECAGGDYVHFDDVEKLLAAQAAVGVASQQEQQPQPSCMLPFAAPASQHNERNAVLDEVAASIIHTFDANEVMRPAYVAECILSHKNKRAVPGSQHDANSAADDQWVFDLAAEHESNRYGLFGLVTFNTTGLVNFSRAIEAELASRFRAPGGNTNDKASPDLASIASQAQGDTELLNFVDEMTLSIRCRDICGGADDADVGFEVIEHHMTKPQDREIGFGNSVRAAIRAAIKHNATPTES